MTCCKKDFATCHKYKTGSTLSSSSLWLLFLANYFLLIFLPIINCHIHSHLCRYNAAIGCLTIILAKPLGDLTKTAPTMSPLWNEKFLEARRRRRGNILPDNDYTPEFWGDVTLKCFFYKKKKKYESKYLSYWEITLLEKCHHHRPESTAKGILQNSLSQFWNQSNKSDVLNNIFLLLVELN